ncbi:uncharacterized protein LOC133238212 isoform X3 [Bos javanicus]|uniref:uncharacterized protein LOC133238212 isoform X3 n=1 Tax=Bos javanicus TaxID=9906 RepID=UPI002AA92C25|nr:uncharacterized protein LOC133238212 isoform X3 [Bos javanicus]
MDSSPLPPRLGKLRLTGDPGFKSVGEPALQGQVPRDPMHPSPCRRSSKGLTSRRPQPEVTPEPLTTALRRPPWRGGLRRRSPNPPRTRLPCVASWPRPPAESRVRASVVVRRSPEEARFSPAQITPDPGCWGKTLNGTFSSLQGSLPLLIMAVSSRTCLREPCPSA